MFAMRCGRVGNRHFFRQHFHNHNLYGARKCAHSSYPVTENYVSFQNKALLTFIRKGSLIELPERSTFFIGISTNGCDVKKVFPNSNAIGDQHSFELIDLLVASLPFPLPGYLLHPSR